MKWLSLALALTIGLSGLSACASIDRLVKYPEPPQVYGGTRTWWPFWREEMGLDYVPGSVSCLFLADFLGGVVLDTLALPWTIYAEVT